MSSDIGSQRSSRATPSVWTWLALMFAVAAMAGSLFLSMGMALRACPLCFYQRAFVMGLVAVLVMSVALRFGEAALIALPLAAAGLGVACFHVFLEVSGKLECPGGVLGVGTAPMQSLALYVILFVLLLIDASYSSRGLAIAGGIALGAVLAFFSCVSNPPMPSPPSAPHPAPPDICRPPFRA